MKSLIVFSFVLAVVGIVLYFATFGWAFAALLTLFAFGTTWFWGLFLWANLALLVFIDSVELEDEYIGSATVTFFLTALALHFLGGMQFSSYLTENLNLLIYFIAGYAVIGIVYSFWKWSRFVKKQRGKYNRLRAEFCRNKNITTVEIPDEYLMEWQRYLDDKKYDYKLEIRPQASKFKKKIVAWGCYWPWSALWSILNDPVKRFFLMIFRYFQTVYQSIAERAFRGTESDFRKLSDETISEIARKKEEERQQSPRSRR